MKILNAFPKKAAIAAADTSPSRLVLHMYALGGSGALLAIGEIIHLLSMDDTPTRIDLRINSMDFDEKSDAQQLLKQTGEVLSSMLSELSQRQDTSRVLGALHAASIANRSVMNNVGDETVGACVLRLAKDRGTKAALAEGLKLLIEPKTYSIELGNGGYGSPVAGALIAASHASAIKSVMESQIKEAQEDNTATHVHLVTAGLTGATGFALLPELLRHLSGQDHVFCLLDGGVFLPHSNVFSLQNYQGTKDVAAKAQSAVNGLYHQGLLNNAKCIILNPLNSRSAPYRLCSVCKTESAQMRHACVEYLIGADEVMRMILNPEEKDSYILDLAWDPEQEEDRPLGWSDLGLDGVKYHRLLRKLVLGATTKGLIWDLDDTSIQHIPAINSLLRTGQSFSEIKGQGIEISRVCHGLLQMFWDYSVTGSNLENLNSDIFTIEDRFRLLNIGELDNVLKNKIKADFQLNRLSSYQEVISQAERAKKGKGRANERAVQLWNGKAAFRDGVNSARDAESINDFYTRLFRSVV